MTIELNIQLPAALHELLVQAAHERGTSVDEVIRLTLEQNLHVAKPADDEIVAVCAIEERILRGEE